MVVARVLTLDSEARCRAPDERMRPIERTRHGGEQLRETVTPRDVRELMKEHRLALIRRPTVGGNREDDERSRHATGERDDGVDTLQKLNTMAHA
jgi:hypothetical protein